MGHKLVRDNNEEWCRAHGVSGQWRVSPDPAGALRAKIIEEACEHIKDRDPAELYDLRDALEALIGLEDPDGRHAAVHQLKVREFGLFTRFIEWSPVPAAFADWSPSPSGGTGKGSDDG